MKRFFPIAVLCVLGLSFLSGCSSSDSVFSFDLYSAPENFDPLFADDSSELLIIDNTMIGLLMFDENGEIVPGDAQSYTVSPDGKTYTFTLRSDAKWSDGTPVTAHDYVFAFHRMFDPQHPAKDADSFRMISGASEMMAGQQTVLGVAAQNDTTLVITLTEASDHFPELLCSSSAVPCKETFFQETKGRYGLSKETCLFNGPFVISNIYEDVIYLAKNDQYWGQDSVSLSYVSLNIVDSEENDPVSRYTSGSTDAAFLTASQLSQAGIDSSDQVLSSENCTWALIFSPSGNASDVRLRRALAHSTNPESFLSSETSSLTAAQGLIPSAITLGGESYRTQAGTVRPVYDVSAAQSYLSQYLQASGLSKLSTITILCPDNDLLLQALQEQVQIWQRDLQVYLNISVLPQSEIDSAVQSGAYDLALVSYTSSYNDPLSFLTAFSSGSSLYTNSSFDQLLQQAYSTSAPAVRCSLVQAAEQMLMGDLPCLPMFCERNFLAVDNDFEGLFTSPSFSRVFFHKIKES